MSGRHQGGQKNWGECRAGKRDGGEELPARMSYFSERVGKQGRYKWGWEQSTGISIRVRWLNYCCIIPHVFDKLPQKGKNKQSCTV